MRSVAIITLSILMAVAYGILHDLVTAHVCVEYFTIAHPPVFGTEDPILLALGWGVIATWWVGLLLGIPLAIAARAGSRPRKVARGLVRPILKLVGIMGIFALIAGGIGYFESQAGWITLPRSLATEIAPERHARFMFDAWAHSTSYLVGFIGGVVLIVRTFRSRKHLSE